MSGRLDGKVALVTGAAQGIGEAIARRFAEEGADLILTDVNGAALSSLARELSAHSSVQDVADEGGWDRLQADITEKYGRLDVLVNNAGVEHVGPIEDTSLEAWRHLMSINVEGVFLACRSMLPLLDAAGKKGEPASVVNMSSIAGLIGFPNQVAYNSSKGAVRILTKSLAIEWADAGRNIRVNSIHPGCIRTPMLEFAVEGWVREGAVNEQDPWREVGDMCPMRRVGTPSDIANGALYLASDESRFVTGIELSIDGGWFAK